MNNYKLHQRAKLLKRESDDMQRAYNRHKGSFDKYFGDMELHSGRFIQGIGYLPVFLIAEGIKSRLVAEGRTNIKSFRDEDFDVMLQVINVLSPAPALSTSKLNEPRKRAMVYDAFNSITRSFEENFVGQYKLFVDKARFIYRLINQQQESFVPEEIRKSVLDTIGTFLTNAESKTTPDSLNAFIKSFVESNKDGKLDTARDSFIRYSNALIEWKQKLSEQRSRNIVQSMQKNLEEEVQKEQITRNYYASTPEGRMLAFGFYNLERKRVAKERNNESESALDSLERLAMEKGESLKEQDEVTNIDLVDALQKKGYFEEDEAALIRTIVSKWYEKQEVKTIDEDIADRQLCKDWIGLNYSLDDEKIRALLPHVTSEKITVLENAIDGASSTMARRALIIANPELLAMGERDSVRYANLLKETLLRCQPYTQREDIGFDIEKKPSAFASMAGLTRIQRSLDEMLQGQEPAEEITEIQRIEQQLRDSEFDSNSIMNVVRGFRAGGRYHFGKHGLGEDSVIANIRREQQQGIDEKAIDRALRLLIQQGAVLESNGKLSLNSHVNEINDSPIRNLIELVSRREVKL